MEELPQPPRARQAGRPAARSAGRPATEGGPRRPSGAGQPPPAPPAGRPGARARFGQNDGLAAALDERDAVAADHREGLDGALAAEALAAPELLRAPAGAVIGLTATTPHRDAGVSLHPDRFAPVITARRMGQGHNEAFVVAREDLGHATGHLLPAIALLVARLLDLPAKVSAEGKQIAALERQLARAKERHAGW